MQTQARPQLNQAYVQPRDEVEQKLTEIWAKVLGIDQVGIHDNFFDLGGHSLAATRVVSQVIKKFQLELPIQLLFQAPTVAEMAAVIMESQGRKLADSELDLILGELESLTDQETGRLLTEAIGDKKA